MFFIILIFLLSITGYAKAGHESAAEYAVKAAYIYNILRFVSWNEDSELAHTETLNICLFKSNPFGRHLEPISKKSIGNKPIKLRTIGSVEQSAACHLIFIEDSKVLRSLKQSAQQFRHSDSILLGNDIAFLKNGGLFSFYIENQKVRLGANRAVLADTELKISAMLIEVCQLYGEER